MTQSYEKKLHNTATCAATYKTAKPYYIPTPVIIYPVITSFSDADKMGKNKRGQSTSEQNQPKRRDTHYESS
jgi:hypothetical protein